MSKLRMHDDSRFHINVKAITLFFIGHGHFGIISHPGLKNLTASSWVSSIYNNNNNNSSNDVIIKSIIKAKSMYFLLLPDLSQKQMVLLERKTNVFYFLIKIPNLNLY